MKKFIVSVITLALVATVTSVNARELTAKEKDIITAKVKAQLKDPDSAKIEWQDYKGGEGYCAHVNAKNSYGGYAGKALIIASVKKDNNGNIISADAIIHSDESEKLMAPICTDLGYSA